MARDTHTHTHTHVEPGAPETPEDVCAHIHTHTSQEEESASPIILNVYQRMIEASRIIDGMPWAKDQSNTQFKSIPIDKMRAGVRKACIGAGLVHVGPIDLDYEAKTKDGRITVYSGTCVFRYINADDPSDYVDYVSMGEAMDPGDKGTGKFITNLIKNHYKTCWDIGENDDVDRYSYELEDLEAEAEARAQRRRKNLEAVKTDKFFGAPPDERAPLRRKIGELMKDHPDVISQFKAKFGLVPDWTKETLEKCIAECEGAKS